MKKTLTILTLMMLFSLTLMGCQKLFKKTDEVNQPDTSATSADEDADELESLQEETVNASASIDEANSIESEMGSVLDEIK